MPSVACGEHAGRVAPSRQNGRVSSRLRTLVVSSPGRLRAARASDFEPVPGLALLAEAVFRIEEMAKALPARSPLREVPATCHSLRVVPAGNPDSLTPILLRLPCHRRRVRVLHLEPIRRAPRAVRRVLPLRHDTFQPHLAGMAEDGRSVAFQVLIEPQAKTGFGQLLWSVALRTSSGSRPAMGRLPRAKPALEKVIGATA
jgi:hypothetical protein